MFRKIGKKKLKSSLRKRSVEDGNEEETTTTAASSSAKAGVSPEASSSDLIEKTKKRQKILSSLPRRTTLATVRESLSANPSDATSARIQAAANKTTVAETSRERILEEKHQEAMETFIRERLGEIGDNDVSDKNSTKTPTIYAPRTVSELYHHVVQSVVGSTEESGTKEASSTDSVNEGGKESMMLAGTAGLVEVVLPASERLERVWETKEIVPGRGSSSGRRHPPLQNPSEASHHHHQHPSHSEEDDSSGRVGFDALRGRRVVPKAQASHDDQVYQRFVQRERQKQAR